MRSLLELAQGQPVRAQAQHEIEEPPRAEEARRRERQVELPARLAAARAPHSPGEVEQELEVAAHPGWRRPEPARVAGRVAHGQEVEREVVVVSLETLYQEQWLKLLELADDIRGFIKENEGKLKKKD